MKEESKMANMSKRERKRMKPTEKEGRNNLN